MNTSSWWSTLANHGDDQLHWTLDKPNYPLYNSNYPLDQPNYPIDHVESWGQRVVWGVSSCGWEGVLLFWESYLVFSAANSNSIHFYQSSHIVHTECVAWNNGNHDGWALAGQQLSDSLKRRPVGYATDDLIHTYVGLSPNLLLDGRDCRHTTKATN